MKTNSKYYFSSESASKKVVRKTQFSDFKNYEKEELTFQKSETSSSIDQDALSINCKRAEEDNVDGNCMNLSSILIRQLANDDLGLDHDKIENLNSIVNELNLDESIEKITLMQEVVPIKIEKIFKITRIQNIYDLENAESLNPNEDLWDKNFNKFDCRIPMFSIQRISRKNKDIRCKDIVSTTSNILAGNSISTEHNKHLKIFKIQKRNRMELEKNTENSTDKSQDECNKNFRIYFQIEKYKNNKSKRNNSIKLVKNEIHNKNCAKTPEKIDIEEYYQILVKKLEEKYIQINTNSESKDCLDSLSNFTISSENKFSLICKLLYCSQNKNTPIAYPKAVRADYRIIK